MMQGTIQDERCVKGDVLFNNMANLTTGKISKAKRDVYYGARPEQTHRDVPDRLNSHVVPSTNDNLPVAPNFFVEVKAPDGPSAVAARQACYDGALGARGMHSLRTYGQEEITSKTTSTPSHPRFITAT